MSKHRDHSFRSSPVDFRTELDMPYAVLFEANELDIEDIVYIEMNSS